MLSLPNPYSPNNPARLVFAAATAYEIVIQMGDALLTLAGAINRPEEAAVQVLEALYPLLQLAFAPGPEGLNQARRIGGHLAMGVIGSIDGALFPDPIRRYDSALVFGLSGYRLLQTLRDASSTPVALVPFREGIVKGASLLMVPWSMGRFIGPLLLDLILALLGLILPELELGNLLVRLFPRIRRMMDAIDETIDVVRFGEQVERAIQRSPGGRAHIPRAHTPDVPGAQSRSVSPQRRGLAAEPPTPQRRRDVGGGPAEGGTPRAGQEASGASEGTGAAGGGEPGAGGAGASVARNFPAELVEYFGDSIRRVRDPSNKLTLLYRRCRGGNAQGCMELMLFRTAAEERNTRLLHVLQDPTPQRRAGRLVTPKRVDAYRELDSGGTDRVEITSIVERSSNRYQLRNRLAAKIGAAQHREGLADASGHPIPRVVTHYVGIMQEPGESVEAVRRFAQRGLDQIQGRGDSSGQAWLAPERGILGIRFVLVPRSRGVAPTVVLSWP
jgi:hypothetical protein